MSLTCLWRRKRIAGYSASRDSKQSYKVANEVHCDICGKSMEVQKDITGGGRVYCSCSQVWDFDPDGTCRCTVAGKVYSPIMSMDMRREGILYACNRGKFRISARLALGLYTSEEAALANEYIDGLAADALSKLPA